MNASTKRNVMRSLLLLHLMGLTSLVGMRLAAIVIDHQTSGVGFPLLAFGRDLDGVLARSLALPGFLLVVVSGIAMTLLRYGRRPPVWIWIKIGLTSIALFVATPLVAPSLRAARDWAHWSLQHNQLAPQFQASVAQASLYGAFVFAFVLLNIPIGIWKPVFSAKHARLDAAGKSPSEEGGAVTPMQKASARGGNL